EVLQFAANHHADQTVTVDIGHPDAADQLAVFQNGRLVGQLEHFLEAVRDIDDGDALRLQLAQTVKQKRRLASGDDGGGFVEDQKLDRPDEGLGDLDHLLVGDRQGSDLAVDVDLGTEIAQDLGRAPAHGCVV